MHMNGLLLLVAVVGLLAAALVVIGVSLLRSLRQRRAAAPASATSTAPHQRPIAAAELSTVGELAAEPAPRRRQLVPVSQQLAAQPQLPSALADEPHAAAPRPAPFDAHELEVRLGRLFDGFCRGDLTLDGYVAQISQERDALVKSLAAQAPLDDAETPGDSPRAALGEALAAIDWCLQWAEDQRGEVPAEAA